jgi:hypothetical protein
MEEALVGVFRRVPRIPSNWCMGNKMNGIYNDQETRQQTLTISTITGTNGKLDCPRRPVDQYFSR